MTFLLSLKLFEEMPSFSNKFILQICTLTVLILIIIEIFFSVLLSSRFLLTISISSFTDAICYSISSYSEKLKEQGGTSDYKMRLFFDVLVPGFSVFVLIMLTSFLIVEEVFVLYSDIHENENHHFYFLIFLVFPMMHVIVDMFCFLMFYHRGETQIFFEVPDSEELDYIDRAFSLENEFGSLDDDIDSIATLVNTSSDHIDLKQFHSFNKLVFLFPTFLLSVPPQESYRRKKNLNMISAMIHINSDCFRNIMLIIGLTFSYFINQDVYHIDCYASLFICTLCVIVIIPFIVEIIVVGKDLQSNNLYNPIRNSNDADDEMSFTFTV